MAALIKELLGQKLVGANMITEAQLQSALDWQKLHGGKLGRNLIALGFLSHRGFIIDRNDRLQVRNC